MGLAWQCATEVRAQPYITSTGRQHSPEPPPFRTPQRHDLLLPGSSAVPLYRREEHFSVVFCSSPDYPEKSPAPSFSRVGYVRRHKTLSLKKQEISMRHREGGGPCVSILFKTLFLLTGASQSTLLKSYIITSENKKI